MQKPAFRIHPGRLKGQSVWWLKQTAGHEVIPNPIAFSQAAGFGESYARFISDGYGCTVTTVRHDGSETREHEPSHGAVTMFH